MKIVEIDTRYKQVLEDGRVFYRIRALRDFMIQNVFVKADELGGWYEEEFCRDNLFWISYDSLVGGVILLNTFIGSNTIIDNGGFSVAGTIVNSTVGDHVRIDGSVHVEDSRIRDNVTIENCQIDNCLIYSTSSDNFINLKNCRISNSNLISLNANINIKKAILHNVSAYANNGTDLIMTNGQKIRDVTMMSDNYDNNLTKSLWAQLGIVPINGKVYAYKKVNKDLTSFYDPCFKYRVGEIVEAEKINLDPSVSCDAGLHFSTANYDFGRDSDYSILYAEIDVKDIICVNDGKIRCKKAKILGVCDEF